MSNTWGHEHTVGMVTATSDAEETEISLVWSENADLKLPLHMLAFPEILLTQQLFDVVY